MRKVLFVCYANTCRSPIALGIAQAIAKNKDLTPEFIFDSAGTSAYHVGKPADQRSIAICQAHGIDISKHLARQVLIEDFSNFDYILAIDVNNFTTLKELAPSNFHHKIFLLLDFLPNKEQQSVPDPYLLPNGFEVIYQLMYQAVDNFLTSI